MTALDVRPREERSLREIYHDYTSATGSSIWQTPINLLHVPTPRETGNSDDDEDNDNIGLSDGTLRPLKLRRIIAGQSQNHLFQAAFPPPKISLESILPGAVKRIEKAREKCMTLQSISERIKCHAFSSDALNGTTNQMSKSSPKKKEIDRLTVDSPRKKKERDERVPYIQDVVFRQEDYDSIIEYDMDALDRQFIILLEQDLAAQAKVSPVNGNRIKKPDNGSGALTIGPFLFEWLIDRFEKFWHSLIGPLVQRELSSLLPDDETLCAICGSGEACNADAIILCDRCDVAVHQCCYGIPNIPEGKWLCLKCAWAPNERVDCAVCPFRSEGAFKQTEEAASLDKANVELGDVGRPQNTGWCHSICAHWLDELSFSNDTYLEPITGVSSIAAPRFKLTCRLCKVKRGAPIQCSNRHCGFAYHPMCMLRANLWTDFKHKKSLCPKHTPPQHRHALRGIHIRGEDHVRIQHSFFLPAFMAKNATNKLDKKQRKKTVRISKKINIEDSETEHEYMSFDEEGDAEGYFSGPSVPSKVSATTGTTNLSAHSDKVSQMTPIVPAVILQLLRRTLDGPGEGNSNEAPFVPVVRQEWAEIPAESRLPTIRAIAHYWSLKRDFKGASLIRRLQLEPLDNLASVTSDAQEIDILTKLVQEGAQHRKNLEHLRNLLDLFKSTVSLQHRSLCLAVKILALWKFPLLVEMKIILDRLCTFDAKKRIFSAPVDANLVPDYHDVVKVPMDLSTMAAKLSSLAYTRLSDMKVKIIRPSACRCTNFHNILV
jgi:PHD-like zinc-binding domain/PHD-finger/Bromodomain